jgi:hypothetical protein
MNYRKTAYVGGILAIGSLAVIWALRIDWPAHVNRRAVHEPIDATSAPTESTADASPLSVAGFVFEDIASDLGVNFEYFRGDTGNLWTIEPHGGGVACLDLDGDGLRDLFFVNGKQLPPDPADSAHLSVVYRNHGSEGMEDVARESGLVVSMYGQGCSSGDYDNDGFQDLLVTGWRECRLFHNNGDGSFLEISGDAGVVGGKWNTGACFADFDRDGSVDLFVANYLDFDAESHKPCVSKELRIGYCGPQHYQALDDFLYRGLGDGRFEDRSSDSGISLPRGPGFGGVAADVDNDAWPDLLVANDAAANFLLHNLGADSPESPIRFRDVAMEWGIALNGNGLPEANMGIACGDFDGNGYQDFGISHFYQEHYTLYQNLAPRGFQDVTQAVGLDFTTRSKMGWGTGFVDFDDDGWLDLFVVNGHINDYPDQVLPYRMTAQAFRNLNGERFADVSSRSGPYFQKPRIGRGTGVVDLDNDGRPEIVVVQHHEPISILTNRTRHANRALALDLVGTVSNRDATNARVTVTLGGAGASGAARHLIRERIAGEGYLGSNDTRLWFGAGDRDQVDRLEVRWPSGRVDAFVDLATSCEYRLIEGQPIRVIRR